MSKTVIQDVLAEFIAGHRSAADTARRLAAILTPQTVPVPANTELELTERERSDALPPDTPGSWDEVYDAYRVSGELTGAQYRALCDAIGGRIPRVRFAAPDPRESRHWVPDRRNVRHVAIGMAHRDGGTLLWSTACGAAGFEVPGEARPELPPDPLCAVCTELTGPVTASAPVTGDQIPVAGEH